MRFFVLALLPSVLAAQSLTGKGVSIELAQHRAARIKDVRYDLSLDITAPDSATGQVTVRWLRSDPGDAILDFRGRRLTSIIVNPTVSDFRGIEVPISAFNGAHIVIPAADLHQGENVATLSFVTDIAPSGASIIKSHDPDGSDYLYTLLVPADANQLFPCFDQPDLKARVTLTLVAPTGWKTLANGAEVKTDTLVTYGAADTTVGHKSWLSLHHSGVVHHFNETKPLSTYLIAFAAGPWSVASSTVNGRTIHVYVRKSRMKEADTDSLLALQHRAVNWMESYFGRPFPFEKMDFLLAPAFPFGGMEHPGAIFYNENSFIFRERPTRQRQLGRFSTILHETAHQWFGDLVTMKWFDDLWLKEGFATYMGAKGLDAIDSTSGAWKTFYQSNKPLAYGVDQTTGTNSLWQKLDNLDQAKSNYGPIVYNKAPSVLKQLNYLVGEPAFQKGIRQFLSSHAYANATWQDLLGAVGTAAGRDLTDFGKNFMLRPGMPIVQQRLTVRNGKIAKLELVQRPAQSISGRGAWPMASKVFLAYDGQPNISLPVEMSDSVTEVRDARGLPAPKYVFANYEDFGYFLTILDSVSTRALLNGGLGWTRDAFLRTMLWGALWDQLRDAQLDPASFAGVALRELPTEKDEQIYASIVSRLNRVVSTYLPTAKRDSLLSIVETTLWSAAADRARPYAIRRSAIDGFISIAQTPAALTNLRSLLSADSVAGEPMRDPTRWSVVDRLLVLNTQDADQRLAEQAARDTTPDGRRRAFTAGAAKKSATVKRDYFTRYFADKSLNEDWASGSLGSFNAPEHAELTLPYLRPALDSLPYIQANRRIFFLGSWLGAFIGGQRSAEALDVVKKYLADHPSLPLDLKQKVLQSMDDLERTVRIRARWGVS